MRFAAVGTWRSRCIFSASLCVLCGTAAIAAANVYVANLGSDDVSVIDRLTSTVSTNVPAGLGPDGVAATPDGRWVYVTNFSSNTISVIDADTNAVTATVPVGSGPVGIAISSDGQFAYVANRADGTLSQIHLPDGAVTATIPVGAGPDAVALTPDGTRAYVTNSFSSMPGLVSVVDTQASAVPASVVVARNPNRVALTPDGRAAYVTNFRSWNVAVIDTDTNVVTATVRVFGRPSGVAVDPDGTQAYVVTLAGQVQRIDTATNRIVDTDSIQVGSQPYGIAVLPAGGFAYVANFASNTVSLIDLNANAAITEIPVGAQPFALAVSCVDAQCAEPPYTPLPTSTGTPTQPANTVSIPTLTPTAVPTATAAAIEVAVGSATGRPGTQASLTVTLHTSGEPVAGVQNDLMFPVQAMLTANPNGKPACKVNAAINKTGAFAFLPSGCQPGTDCVGVRAIIYSFDDLSPIADGSPLYTCTVTIANAPAGMYRVITSNVVASDPIGTALPATGADGEIVVLPSADGAVVSIMAAAASGRLCSGGELDGSACSADADCPGGACVTAQGVCDGGSDDGLLCDCAGGTCSSGASCPVNPAMGTCRGGAADGQCCDPQSNCAGHSPCTGTQKVCASGPGRGLSCLRDIQCPQSQCVPTGKSCSAGEFARFACVADGDCPHGACVSPSEVFPATPVPTPTKISSPLNSGTGVTSTGASAPSTSGGGCAIAPVNDRDGVLMWSLVPALLWACRRYATRIIGGLRDRRP